MPLLFLVGVNYPAPPPGDGGLLTHPPPATSEPTDRRRMSIPHGSLFNMPESLLIPSNIFMIV
jgi:hypothetical protein